jgi:hypothetical protein
VGPHIGPSPMRAADSKGNKVAEGERFLLLHVWLSAVYNQISLRPSRPSNRYQYLPSTCIWSCLHAFARSSAVGAVQEQHAATAEPDSAQRVHAGQRQCARHLADATVSHTHEQGFLPSACPFAHCCASHACYSMSPSCTPCFTQFQVPRTSGGAPERLAHAHAQAL